MRNEDLRCAICATVVPAGEHYMGKVVLGTVASFLGLRSGSPGGAIALGIAGLVVGHIVDLLIADVTRPVCAGCGVTN